MVDEHEDQRITCLMLSWIAQIILKDQAYSEYRITSKSKTVHITIAHHLFVRRNISPITMCNHRHLHRLSGLYFELRSLHCDLFIHSSGCSVRKLQVTIKETRQHGPAKRLQIRKNLHRMKFFHSSQNGGAEYRVHSFKYGPWTMM